MEDCQEVLNKVFFKKYKPESKIGNGSFGSVYKGINVTNKQSIAMKFVNL